MLSALALGSVFPLPIGTPLFLIGVALITLPGKRRLTSGALRGIPIRIYTRKVFWWRLAISLLLPPVALWFLALKKHAVLHPSQMSLWESCVIYGITIAAAWILTWLALQAINGIVRFLPKVRRRVRPWLRKHGISLLPPRNRPRSPNSSLTSKSKRDEGEILAIDRTHVFPWDRRSKR